MNTILSGKTAVVTGASKGIGAAIAEKLGEAGAKVIVNYASDKQGADRVVLKIQEKGGQAKAVQGDVSKQSDIQRLFSEASNTFGNIDILVNNAGIYEFAPVEEVTEDHFHKQFNINVLGLTLSIQESLKYFNPQGGSIINISSVAATLGIPAASVYSATKGAVNSITLSLAKELGSRNIRVNSVSPGMVETEGVHTMGVLETPFRKEIETATPLGRIGQPHDISSVVKFLASEESGWITGEIISVSGGHH